MSGQVGTQQNEGSTERALTIPARLPFPKQAQELFGVDSAQWRALIDAVYPAARTSEGVMLALAYCKARNLDPFKRQCHIVPIWDSKKSTYVESVWPGIAELRTTATRTGQYAGCSEAVFGETKTTTFKDRVKGKNGWQELSATVTYPEWAQLTVYRLVGGERVAFPGPKVRFVELFAGERGSLVPNARWKKAPFSMLEKCAEAAALRKAFPEETGTDEIAEEAGMIVSDTIDGEYTETKAIAKPTREAAAKALEKLQAEAEITGVGQDVNADLAEQEAQLDREYAETIGPRETERKSMFTNTQSQPKPSGPDDTLPSSVEAASAGAPPAENDAGPEAASSGGAAEAAGEAGGEQSLSELTLALDDALKAAADEFALAACWNESKAFRKRLKEEAPAMLEAVTRTLNQRREEFEGGQA